MPENRLLNRWKLGRWDSGLRIVEQGALVPQKAREKVGPVIGGGAGDDAVEVVGKPLRFHESLAAAVRTTDEVPAGGRSAVERLHDGAGLYRGFVHRAVTEIDQLFGMADGPDRTGRGMAVIGARHREATLQRLSEGDKRNISGPSAVSDLLIFSVPITGREPNFEVDFRIGRGARAS